MENPITNDVFNYIILNILQPDERSILSLLNKYWKYKINKKLNICVLIRNGNLKTLMELESYLNLDSSLINLAIKYYQFDIIKWLRSKGTSWNHNSFEIAALYADIEIMNWMKEDGCSVTDKVFTYAASRGDLNIMKWFLLQNLLVMNEKPFREEHIFKWNENTFSESVKLGCLENMKWLKDNGCPWDSSVMSYAIFNGNLENMKWVLIECCSNFNPIFTFGCEIVVAMNNNIENIKWLRKAGLSVSSYTLSQAAISGNINMVKYLLNPLNKENILRDEENCCPWDNKTFACAARGGKLDIMKLLYQVGCPWNTTTAYKCASSGNLDNLKWLLNNGCPVDNTIMDGAVSCGRSGGTKIYICDQNIEPDIVNVPKTAYLDMMKWLRVNGFTWTNDTLRHALYDGNLENIKWLRNNGCPWGNATLRNAFENYNTETIDWLRNNGCPT